MTDELTKRTCSTCGEPATASWHDAGPFGAGTFYGCAEHTPTDVVTERAAQSSGDHDHSWAPTPGLASESCPCGAFRYPDGRPRQHHGDDLGLYPEEDDAYINWCADQGDLDPENALTRAMYADHLDASEREGLRR